MPQITEPGTARRSIVARYAAVWSEPDPGSRRAAIAGLWAADGAEFIEGARFRGHEELDRRIAGAYQEFVASDFMPNGAGRALRCRRVRAQATAEPEGPGLSINPGPPVSCY